LETVKVFGISSSTKARNVGAAAAPVVGPARTLLAVFVLYGFSVSPYAALRLIAGVVPPDEATGDVPVTLVTVPFPVPAPIAVLKSAAFNADTVLSALKRGKVIALGLVRVKRLLPTVVAPRFVLAALAVVAPVPPLAIATVPVTFEAVPVVFWFSVGMSAATIARNVGAPAVPLGAARKLLAVLDAYGFWVSPYPDARLIAGVDPPDDTTGEVPDTEDTPAVMVDHDVPPVPSLVKA
jgi:hypothetical protein